MGGGFVLVLAAQQGDRIAAAVPFYGVLKEDDPDFSGLTAALLGHFGDEDESVPPEAVKALASRIEAETGVTPQFHGYPAGHAFFNDSNALGTYAPDEAEPGYLLVATPPDVVNIEGRTTAGETFGALTQARELPAAWAIVPLPDGAVVDTIVAFGVTNSDLGDAQCGVEDGGSSTSVRLGGGCVVPQQD